MASYDAAINLIVNGGSKVDQIINQLSQLDGIVSQLKKTPIDFNVQTATSAFNKLDANLKVFQTNQKNAQKAVDAAGKAIDKYSDQVVRYQQRLSKENPNTVKYNKILEQQTAAIENLASAQKDLAKAEKDVERYSSSGGLELEVKKAERAKKTAEALNELGKSYLRYGGIVKLTQKGELAKDQPGQSIAQLNAQSSAFKELAANAKIASAEFNRFTIASEIANQRIYEGRQAQIKGLAFGFSGPSVAANVPDVNVRNTSLEAARGQIGEFVKSYGTLVKSEAAMGAFVGRARELQSIVPYISDEWGVLESAINEVVGEMQQLEKSAAGLRGQSSALSPRGQFSLLPQFSVKSAFDQAKYEKKKIDYLDRIDGITERIDRANLSTSQKLDLQVRLEKSLSALTEGRLDDAKAVTIEVEKQRMSMERANRAQKTLVVGALGTEFMPIGGKLPSGEIAPGSPADKQRTARAKLSWQSALAQMSEVAQQIEETAAAKGRKIQMDWNLAFEKAKEIISDATLAGLQEGTKAAVALGKQQLKEIERSTADLWKQYGGPALPPGFTEKGPVTPKATGQFSPVEGQRRLNNILASGAIIQQGLINLQGKGADVTDRLIQLETALNAAKQDGYEISLKNLNALTDEVSLAGKFAQLQRSVLAGRASGGSKRGGESKMFESALSGQEVRQKISDIVKDFNAAAGDTKAPTAGIGENVSSSLAGGIKKGVPGVFSAAISLGAAVERGVKKALGIASPSRVIIEIAQNLVTTYISYLESAIPKIQAVSEKAFGGGFEFPKESTRPLRKGGEDRVQALAEFVSSFLTSGGGNYPSVQKIFDLIQKKGSYLDVSKVPGVDYSQASDDLTRGRIDSEDVKKVREAYAEFYSISSDLAPILKNSSNAANASDAELKQLLQEVRSIVAGLGEIQNLFVSASELANSLKPSLPKSASSSFDVIGDYWSMSARNAEELDKEVRKSFSGPGASSLNEIADFWNSTVNASEKIVEDINRSSKASAQVQSGGGGGRPPAPPAPPAGGGGNGGNVPSEQQMADLLGLGDLAPLNQRTINQLETLSAAFAELRNKTDPLSAEFTQLGQIIDRLDQQRSRLEPGADYLTRRFGQRRAQGISEGLIGGAFPLLFGQGVGASVGGGLGGYFGGMAGGMLGFGLSLVGTAVGTQLDQSVQRVSDLNAGFLLAGESYDKIRETGVQFSAELERQARAARGIGDSVKAQEIERGALQQGLGDIGGAGTEGAAAAASDLTRAWKEFTATVSVTLSIIASPFAVAVARILDLVRLVAKGWNLIFTGIGDLILRIPGLRSAVNGVNEALYEGSAEYQNQLNQIEKQIEASQRLNKAKAEYNGVLQQALGSSKVDFDIASKRADALERQQKLEEDIRQLRESSPQRTQAQRDQLSAQVAQKRITFINEEKTIAIKNAQDTYQEIRDLERETARQKIDNELKYRDLVTSRIREQRDLNLETSRKAEDILLEVAEKRLQIEEKISKQKIDSARASLESQQIDRNIAAIGDPVAKSAAEFQKLIGEYQVDLRSIQDEYISKEKAKQLELTKIQLSFERAKFDTALRVSRVNIDSQKQIAELNRAINRQNEDASRKQFARRIQANLEDLKYLDQLARIQFAQGTRTLDLARQNPQANIDQSAINEAILKREAARVQITQLAPVIATVQDQLSKFASARTSLPGIPSVPNLTYDSSALDAAQSSLRKIIEQGATFKDLVNTAKTRAKELGSAASGAFDAISQKLDDVIVRAKEDSSIRLKTIDLIRAGYGPAVAEQLATLSQTYELQKAIYANRIKDLEAQVATNSNLLDQANLLAESINNHKDKNSQEYKSLQIELDLVQAKILGNQELEKELKKLKERAKLLDPKYQEAAVATIESNRKIGGEQIMKAYGDAQQKLKDLATWENVAVTGAQAIGDAFGQAFQEITAGTASAQEILAGFFQNLANSFANMAAEMISNMAMLAVFQPLMNSFLGPSIGAMFAPGPSGYTFPGLFGFANGDMFANGIQPFAKGGMVDSPTLFKFADGGSMKNGLMGEAGPEAILPLSRGSDGKLGVSASGGGDVSVTVNVDASGSKVQGDNQQASQLGKVVAAAVQEELLRQKRPGGLL